MAERTPKIGMKNTIAVAIAGAFGFIIALIWRDVIIGLMNMACLNIEKFENATGAVLAITFAVIITFV